MAASVVLLPPTTPRTYHRIVSPTLRIPTDPLQPIPVGLLACQRAQVVCEISIAVADVIFRRSASARTSNGRKSKKDKAQPPPSEPLLEVISEDGELWNVIEVKRHGGHAVHYVRARDANAESALRVFTPGSRVGVALGEDGVKRRLDHTSMHTSQHLLSAVIETRLNLPTLSWSLTAYPAPSYVEIPRSMTTEEIATIQEEANRLVFEGRAVHVEVEELDREKISEVPKLESGRNVGKGLPSDYTGGVKRTVIIDGIDRSPCCGTHMPTTHNLQLFLLPHTDALSRSNTSSARLYFLSGPRLITYLTSTHTLLAGTATTLSCGAPQVPERVEQVVEERKKATKRVEDLEAELAAVVAKDLLNVVANDLESPEGAFAHRHRVDDSTNALGFLNAISMSYASQAPSDLEPYLIVLSSSPSSQNASSTSVVLIFGADEEKVREVGEGLNSKLSVKGGGKGTRWSGKFTGIWLEGREGVVVNEVLKTARGM